MPCVLSEEQASDLIGAFLGNVDAESMQKGLSKLAGKIGQAVGGEEFTIIDDPKAPGFGKSELQTPETREKLKRFLETDAAGE